MVAEVIFRSVKKTGKTNESLDNFRYDLQNESLDDLRYNEQQTRIFATGNNGALLLPI
ncbi:MAG: hypothetical protein KF851_03525 [Pirellulaceae bacterium]|nr:hypothetical protein [Pirellulaceae bacterium]